MAHDLPINAGGHPNGATSGQLVLTHTAVRVKPSRDPAVAELVTLWHALVDRMAR